MFQRLIAPCPALLAGAALLLAARPADGQCTEGCTTILEFTGEASGDSHGWVSNSVGDLNSDGINDLILTAPFNDAAGANAGRCYVHSGADGSELFRMTGTVAGGWLGHDGNEAGDIDDDGVPDVIVGAPLAGAGMAVVYSGASAGVGAVIHTFNGEAGGDSFGFRVHGGGDFNGNGRPDVVIGAPGHDTAGAGAGRAYVYEGSDFSLICSIDGPAAGASFGSGVTFIGDINGDGRDDIAVGAQNAGGGGGLGFVYSWDGAACQHEYDLTPPGPSLNFGQWFMNGGFDVNRDGTPDIYVNDFGVNRAHIFSGVDGSTIYELTGDGNGGFGIGRIVEDINGDGHADMILAAWNSSAGASGAGKAFVYSGKDGSVMETFTHDVVGANFGFDANGMGDMNGDGRYDYLITAASDLQGKGRSYVIAGTIDPPPDLLVCGWSSANILRCAADDGNCTSLVASGSAGLNLAHSIELGIDGNLYVTSFGSNAVNRYDALTGAFIDAFVPAGSGGLGSPTDAIFGPDGNLYVTSFGTDCVLRYDGITGAFIDQFVTSGSGGLLNPESLSFGPDGNLYVLSGNNSNVARYEGTTGAFIDIFVSSGSGGLGDPHYMFFHEDGLLYITAFGNNKVIRYDAATGAFVDVFVEDDPGTPGDESGGLSSAHGAAFGVDGFLYVSSFNSNQVLRYDETGAFIDVFISAASGAVGPIDVVFAGSADPCLSEPEDCNTNGVPDACEIASGGADDCNGNGVPDDCDVASGASEDCNANGIPDECDLVVTESFGSGLLSPIGFGSPQSFTIVAPPAPMTDVTVDATLFGEFEGDPNWIMVALNGTNLGQIMNGPDAMSCAESSDTLVIDAVTFDSLVAGGDAVFTFTTSVWVDPNFCLDPSYLDATVSFGVPSALDANGNGIIDECECAADLTGPDGIPDGAVDALDFLLLIGQWGTPCVGTCEGDIVGPDGNVDAQDFLLLIAQWGTPGFCP
jgi:WD40 repeat protein